MGFERSLLRGLVVGDSRELTRDRMATTRPKPRWRLKYENHLVLLASVAAAPAVVAALLFVWLEPYSSNARWTISLVIILFLWAGLAALRHRARFPLQTLSNLVAAMREGDFSTRARGSASGDAMGELAFEVNALAAHLREQRLDSMEATVLLRTVMAEVDVAVFAFDPAHRLILVNRAGEKILGRAREHLLGRAAAELGLSECLVGEQSRILSRTFPNGGERWSIRRGTFRQGGVQNDLLVLTDLSRALREEERQAWQRLLRVLGHELNNSLAPIKSIAASLEQLIALERKPGDWQDDLKAGLNVISSRTAALTRFMEAYSTLARLPAPRLQPVALSPLLERVATIETRMKIEIQAGPPLTITADPDQLEQLLINLLRNSVDAVLEHSQWAGQNTSKVRLGWLANNSQVEISIEDEGPGIANPANLFVPFFTTKPGGSGIGLVLSRQIAEAHGGSLLLENRKNGSGCIARLRLRLA
jgi:two-component system nitrogen regulation sensor histidine kinase NtrY